MKQTADMGNVPLRLMVSRCLLGEAVRYDGASKPDAAIRALAKEAELLPVCPEVEAGLAVPRPPVRLVATGRGRRMLGVADPALDVTTAVAGFARDFLAAHSGLHGGILKARSPSCGIGDSPLFDTAGMPQGLDSGLFATAASQAGLPLISEQQFASTAHRNRFFEQVFVRRFWLQGKNQDLALPVFHRQLQGHMQARRLADPGMAVRIETLEGLAARDSDRYLAALMTLLARPVAASVVEQAVLRGLQEQGESLAVRQLWDCLGSGQRLPTCLAAQANAAWRDNSLLYRITEQEWSLRFG